VPLFKHLNDGIFLPFSRSGKWLYEKCLIAIYERFYKDSPRFPLQKEMLETIYETLKAHPDLWTEEETVAAAPDLVIHGRRRVGRRGGKASREVADAVLSRARIVYDNLVETGWLEEERFGIQVTVDMTPGALQMMQRLYEIQEGFALRFTGTLVQLNLTLRGLSEDPRANAASLQVVRKNLEGFVRHLRAIIADLKRVRNEMTNADNQAGRIRAFLEGFVREMLLQDFAALHTVNHPYRYKNETLREAQRLSTDDRVLRQAGLSYAEMDTPDAFAQGTSEEDRLQAHQKGIRKVEQDFDAVLSILEHIDQLFEKINGFQRHLEERLRNMIRYKDRGKRGFINRAETAVGRLSALLAGAPERYEETRLQGPLVPYLRPFGEHYQATPRRDREPIEAKLLRVTEPDPVDTFLKKLVRQHGVRLNPTPVQLATFLDRKAGQTAVLGSSIPLETVDDFIALYSVIGMVRTGEIPAAISGSFEILRTDGTIDNDWIRCEDFVIKRKGGSLDAA
jgi:hypothetical protein